MIIRTSNGNDLELRDLFTGSDRIPRPGESQGGYSYAGKPVNFDTAAGIPAVMAAIRLIADTIASLPLQVFETNTAGITEPATEMPQWNLLNREPNETQTAFQVWSHTLSSMLGWGNGYLLKAYDGRQVIGLYPLDPSRVTPRVEQGEVVFYVRNQSTDWRPYMEEATRLTRSDVLHVPGMLINDPFIGVSPISVHRHALGNAIAQQEFVGRYYSNDASPGGVITVPGTLTREKLEELREGFEARHRGLQASHRTAILSGGATYDSGAGQINLRDAAFIEKTQADVQDIARMFGLPASLLDAADFNHASTPEQDQSRFQVRLTPWMRRLESALETDADLFPDRDLPGRPDYDPCVRFDANQLVRADLAARFAAYTAARQGGWLSANEIRAQENLPPVAGGDQVQVTPVGGAPNPDAQAAETEPTTELADQAEPVAAGELY
jgi:HK97 family phage portal protein